MPPCSTRWTHQCWRPNTQCVSVPSREETEKVCVCESARDCWTPHAVRPATTFTEAQDAHPATLQCRSNVLPAISDPDVEGEVCCLDYIPCTRPSNDTAELIVFCRCRAVHLQPSGGVSDDGFDSNHLTLFLVTREAYRQAGRQADSSRASVFEGV